MEQYKDEKKDDKKDEKKDDKKEEKKEAKKEAKKPSKRLNDGNPDDYYDAKDAAAKEDPAKGPTNLDTATKEVA